MRRCSRVKVDRDWQLHYGFGYLGAFWREIGVSYYYAIVDGRNFDLRHRRDYVDFYSSKMRSQHLRLYSAST